MGSFGKLATRALETDMPVMVQVFRLEPSWVLFYLFEYICFQLQFATGFVYCIWCGNKVFAIGGEEVGGSGFCRYRN